MVVFLKTRRVPDTALAGTAGSLGPAANPEAAEKKGLEMTSSRARAHD